MNVERALIEDQALDGASVGQRQFRADGPGAFTPPQRTEIANEIAALGLGQRWKRRHPRDWEPLPEEDRQVLVGPGGNSIDDGGSELAAVAVTPVAAGTANDEYLLAGARTLSGGNRGDEQTEGEDGSSHAVNVSPLEIPTIATAQIPRRKAGFSLSAGRGDEDVDQVLAAPSSVGLVPELVPRPVPGQRRFVGAGGGQGIVDVHDANHLRQQWDGIAAEPEPSSRSWWRGRGEKKQIACQPT